MKFQFITQCRHKVTSAPADLWSPGELKVRIAPKIYIKYVKYDNKYRSVSFVKLAKAILE